MRYAKVLPVAALALAIAGSAHALLVLGSDGEPIVPDAEGRYVLPLDAIDVTDSWKVGFCEIAGDSAPGEPFDLLQVKMIQGDLFDDPGFRGFQSKDSTTSPYPQTGAAIAASWHEYFNSPTVCAATGLEMIVFSPRLYSHNKMNLALGFQGEWDVNEPQFYYQKYYQGQLMSNERWEWHSNFGAGNPNHAGDFTKFVESEGDPGPFWSANSPIPEPLTMLGMFLGLGSVGVYIRKRRLA